MKLTAKEKQRREAANARRRDKVRKLKRRGLCRCGERLDKNPKTRRNYSLCSTCREQNLQRLYERYHGLVPEKEKTPIKFDRRLKDSTGVLRRYLRDGMGREAWWWTASAYVNGKTKMRRFSIDKHGDLGAHRMAMRQRLDWEEEMYE